MKELISIIAVVMTFAAYVPYYRDILKGKTHPHIYSWSLWGLLTILIVALQIKGGAGPSTFITASAGLLCIGVIVLGLKRGKRDITTSDTIVALLALVAITFWLVVDQPLIAIILAVTADLLAFIPTVRKSWNKPHSETLSMYVTNTIRFMMAVIALENFTLLAALWPVAWAVGNGLFSVMLVIRRRQVKQ
jgi:hypothetical protein